MADIKIQHLLTLSYLLSVGAQYNFVHITTGLLGKSIKRSQQAASKHLVELEDGNFIERITDGRRMSVKITKKGYDQILSLYSALESGLSSSPPYIRLHGRLVAGMGEGAYYMSRKGYTRQFKSCIGYAPFPGTLNVMLEDKADIKTVMQLDGMEGIKIDGFADGTRTYGWVKCFAAVLNDSIDCHLIRLERTHHDPSIIELISQSNIRKKARLQNGSDVTIVIPVSH